MDQRIETTNETLDIFLSLTKSILPKIDLMANGFHISEDIQNVNQQSSTICQFLNPNCNFHLLRKISTIKYFNISHSKSGNVLIKYKVHCNLFLMECFNCKIQFISAHLSGKHDKFDGLGLAITAHYNSSRIL